MKLAIYRHFDLTALRSIGSSVYRPFGLSGFPHYGCTIVLSIGIRECLTEKKYLSLFMTPCVARRYGSPTKGGGQNRLLQI